MGWTNTAEDPFTVPAGAVPGTPQISRGTVLPAPLDTYTFALGTSRYAAADIFNAGRGASTYDYLAVAITPTGTVIHFGHVEAGAVVEHAPGQPAVLELSYGVGGFGRQYAATGEQFNVDVTDHVGLAASFIEIYADLLWTRGDLKHQGSANVLGDVAIFGQSIPRGPRFSNYSASSSAAFGTSETEVLAVSGVTYEAGRAYAVRFGTLLQADTANTRPLVRLRDQDGRDLGEYGRFPTPVAAEPVSAQGTVYVANRTLDDITGQTCRLIAFTTAGTCIFRTTSATLRYLAIDDAGHESQYPYAMSL